MENVIIEEDADSITVKVGTLFYTSYDKTRGKIRINHFEKRFYITIEEEGIIRAIHVWHKDGSCTTSCLFNGKGEVVQSNSTYFY